MEQRRTTMQSVQGKLCNALYEKFGDAVLPVIEKIYGDYGYELGLGFREKWRPRNLEEAGRAFIAMCNEAGYASEMEMRDGVSYWSGHYCPFGLDNTRKAVCEAMMAMDREMMRALLDLPPGAVDLVIEKSLAAGDGCCQGRTSLKDPAGEGGGE